MYHAETQDQVFSESSGARRLEREFMACMVKCSLAWCERWPKVDTVILDPPEHDEDEETDVEELPVEGEPDETPSDPEEVEDGTSGDGEPSGGYRYNSFL